MDAVADGGHGSSPNRIRTITSITLAVLGGILVLLGTILLYTREELIDQEAFVDKAGEALQDDAVREVVATELVVGLIEQGSPDLIAGRPPRIRRQHRARHLAVPAGIPRGGA